MSATDDETGVTAGGSMTENTETETTTSDSVTESAETGLFPVPSSWFKIGFYVFLGIWALYLLYEAIGYSDFEDYFVPYLMLTVALILIPLKLAMILFPDRFADSTPNGSGSSTESLKDRVEEQSEVSTRAKAKREKYELIMLGWVTVLPIMMYVIGMGWSIIIYTFAFTWYFVRDIKTASLITIGVITFITILFMYILNMLVWTGLYGFPDPLIYLEGQLDIVVSRLLGLL